MGPFLFLERKKIAFSWCLKMDRLNLSGYEYEKPIWFVFSSFYGRLQCKPGASNDS